MINYYPDETTPESKTVSATGGYSRYRRAGVAYLDNFGTGTSENV